MVDNFVPVSEPSLGPLERSKFLKAFDSTWISSSGEFLDEFETKFAVACQAEFSLAVANGTVALHLALAALGVQSGDEVVVPSLTYIATANAVTYTGGEPVFAEVSEQDWCLSVESVEEVLSERTVGIIAVHLYGHPADLRALRHFCDARGLFLIEDAAEAPFSERAGLVAGSVGDVATFSFYGNKVISSGEGGAVTTSNRALAERMRLLRGQGMDPERRYYFPIVGYNYRLTNVAAAILCGQLERRNELIDARRRVCAEYDQALGEEKGIYLQPRCDDALTSPWLYCVTFETGIARDAVMRDLLAENIDTRPFFVALHQLPPYVGSRRAKNLELTESLSCRGVNLPTYPGLALDTVRAVADAVVRSVRGAHFET